MSGFNLPPGCSVNDIPGNRPEDAEFERQVEEIETALQPMIHPLNKSDEVEQATKNIVVLINKAFEAGYQQAVSDGDEARFYREQSKGEEHAP